MIAKAAYVERISASLDAKGELGFLHLLSQEELRILWAKVATKTLRVARETPPEPPSMPFSLRLEQPRRVGLGRRRP